MPPVLSRIAYLLGAPFQSSGTFHTNLKADAIVILGAPVRPDHSLPPITEERVRIGVTLYQRGLAPVVCVTGGHCPRGHKHSLAEAEGMARWVRAAGVPEEAIRIDRKATSTLENAERAKEILFPEGRQRVWLVTQPFHMKRALFLFERAGFEALGYPIVNGVQHQNPTASIRWIVREYGSWALLGARLLRGAV